jgi:hypothetical protein
MNRIMVKLNNCEKQNLEKIVTLKITYESTGIFEKLTNEDRWVIDNYI